MFSRVEVVLTVSTTATFEMPSVVCSSRVLEAWRAWQANPCLEAVEQSDRTNWKDPCSCRCRLALLQGDPTLLAFTLH